MFFATASIEVRFGNAMVINEKFFTHAVVVDTIVLVGLCHTSMVAVDTPSKSTNGVNVMLVLVSLMCIPTKRKNGFLLQKKSPTEWRGLSIYGVKLKLSRNNGSDYTCNFGVIVRINWQWRQWLT